MQELPVKYNVEDGIHIQYTEETKTIRIAHIKNGLRHGLFKEYTKEGVFLGEALNIDGFNEGDSLEYYHNTDKLYSSTPYKNGKKHGIVTLYYINGNKESEEMYVNGIKDGNAFYYSSDGTLEYIKNYVNDVLVQEIKPPYKLVQKPPKVQ